MMRFRWISGLFAALATLWITNGAQAQPADSTDAGARIARPSAALLMRLARARQLSARPRTFSTQVGTAVAARRHGDAIEQRKRTLDILNNQYLRGTAATTPGESEIRQTIATLEQQLNSATPPENVYEIRYYLAACHESLGDIDRSRELLRGIIEQFGADDSDIVASFVEQARADLTRLGE